eukprot:838897-Pyramimonas_sp.AAC.1
MCGRDKNGQPDPKGPPDRDRTRERAPSTPRRRNDGDAKNESDAVAQTRKALASLRRCGLADDNDL